MPDKIRACQWGSFDVENYGDRLFPLIASEQLTARLPKRAGRTRCPPPGSPPLFPWSRMVDR